MTNQCTHRWVTCVMDPNGPYAKCQDCGERLDHIKVNVHGMPDYEPIKATITSCTVDMPEKQPRARVAAYGAFPTTEPTLPPGWKDETLYSCLLWMRVLKEAYSDDNMLDTYDPVALDNDIKALEDKIKADCVVATKPVEIDGFKVPVDLWQDINTAPRDGRRVMLWNEDWTGPCSGQFYGQKGWGWGIDYVLSGFKYQPTHWKPLDPPPHNITRKE